jgi:hypothetical protein
VCDVFVGDNLEIRTSFFVIRQRSDCAPTEIERAESLVKLMY